ncbi:hypothetical protein [Streptomyces sp. NBC_01003]|uniref:hypothetical protein n=1 Tax=Streptomyces sp. NBC_01003 TaxID=2903714 RepID=UPI003864F768
MTRVRPPCRSFTFPAYWWILRCRLQTDRHSTGSRDSRGRVCRRTEGDCANQIADGRGKCGA